MVTTLRLTAWPGGTDVTMTAPEATTDPVADLDLRLDEDARPEANPVPDPHLPEVMQPGPVEMSEPSTLWWSKEL